MPPQHSLLQQHFAQWHQRRRRAAIIATLAAATVVHSIIVDSLEKIPYHTSILSGQRWLVELMSSPNPHRFREQLGLCRDTFVTLVVQLSQLSSLEDGRMVSLEEQVAIFLYTVVGNESTRRTGERFQRSTETISRYINRIADALTSSAFYHKYVKLPSAAVPPEIEDNPKFYPYFKHIRAAMDGSHIQANPPAQDLARYRNRKGGVSQNVLLSCTFDMKFCHVLSGWEGSAAGTLFEDARANDLVIPTGKQYLADAGFAICDALLVPYRGVRYHLREWGKANTRPANSKELFNLCHAELRNVVEHIIGVYKKHFKIVRELNYWPIPLQVKLVTALCALHNFIRIHDPLDDMDITIEELEQMMGEDWPAGGELQRGISLDEIARASATRDRIAAEMWEDYQDHAEDQRLRRTNSRRRVCASMRDL